MILSDKDIRVLCTQPEHPLISPFDEFRLQGASYDVSMSDVIHVFKDDVRTISLTDQIRLILCTKKFLFPILLHSF